MSPQLDLSTSAQRQNKLLAVAWISTLLPLVAFAYLGWQAVDLKKRNDAAQARLTGLQEQEATLKAQVADLDLKRQQLSSALDAQRESTKYYRDFAGVRIQFYRESDREVVEKALKGFGFNIETRLGTSALIDRTPNTIAYGSMVSPQDLRDIAIALVNAGFPLKRIAPATRQPDPKLIQIYASAESDRSCKPLSVADIQAGEVCGGS